MEGKSYISCMALRKGVTQSAYFLIPNQSCMTLTFQLYLLNLLLYYVKVPVHCQKTLL